MLAAHWEDRIDEFGFISGSRFIRVNDISCKRRKAEFLCMVGVIATEQGRPAYKRVPQLFYRDPATTVLKTVEPEEIVVT